MEIKGVMHRDLKPQNILIEINQQNQENVILCDFGQSKFYSFDDKKHSEEIATLWYKAPEILFGSEEYDQGIDVWAVGCILAELSQGYSLFKAETEVGQIFSILEFLGTPTES